MNLKDIAGASLFISCNTLPIYNFFTDIPFLIHAPQLKVRAPCHHNDDQLYHANLDLHILIYACVNLLCQLPMSYLPDLTSVIVFSLVSWVEALESLRLVKYSIDIGQNSLYFVDDKVNSS
jgi:hypothetical protein